MALGPKMTTPGVIREVVSFQQIPTGPLLKLFHYAIFQKFFHIFIIH